MLRLHLRLSIIWTYVRKCWKTYNLNAKYRMRFFSSAKLCLISVPLKKLMCLWDATWKASDFGLSDTKRLWKIFHRQLFPDRIFERIQLCCWAHHLHRLMCTPALRDSCWFVHRATGREEKTACALGRCKGIESLLPLGCQGNTLAGLHMFTWHSTHLSALF